MTKVSAIAGPQNTAKNNARFYRSDPANKLTSVWRKTKFRQELFAFKLWNGTVESRSLNKFQIAQCFEIQSQNFKGVSDRQARLQQTRQIDK